MLYGLKDGIRWSARLGAKFFWAVPGATSAVVLATLVGQVSMLLAFFLPLKVIILLGSEGIPRYFPPAFAAVERDALIVWLSLAAVGFYGLYLVADRIIALGSERGAGQLLARSRKMVLFEGQDEVASSAYKRYANALAGGLFVFLVIVLLLWLYPAVAGLMLVYSAVVAVALLLGQVFSSRFREWVEEQLGVTLSVLGAVGFMLSFVYLVADFLYRDPPGLIPAIIALLLSRQAFTRLSSLVPALSRLYEERARLDALFFHRRAFAPSGQDTKKALAPLFLPERRKEWVPSVLEALTGEPWPADGTIRWHQLAAGEVFALDCRTPEGPRYLVKLFGARHTGQARHEATLLTDPPVGLPAPEWVGATEVRGFQCHVLRLPAEGKGPGQTDDAADRVREALLPLQPDKALVQRYARSRAFLWQRLDDALLEPLRAATGGATEQHLEVLRASLPEWQTHLRDTPLAFLNPDLNPENLLEAPEAEGLMVLHWGRWSLEPAGAGWRTNPKALEALREALAGARNQRPSLAEASEQQLILSALTAQLEKELNGQRFSKALKPLKPIRSTLERLAPADPEST
ncbi:MULTISPECIES: hypothetical protein [unclassified Thioalkalivibrio]|uniref:hypothetical protein n=1 Tax=unclassified Thioalkalivibrio TaxID=2621013 RepID=UPI00037D413C|nr:MULTISPECIES: hypothetical protein [unclassified Thioalkalivibrio]